MKLRKEESIPKLDIRFVYQLSHSLPQFRHKFWPKFWADLAGPKFGLPEKIPSPRESVLVAERLEFNFYF